MAQWKIRVIGKGKFPREARLAREFSRFIARALEKQSRFRYVKNKKEIQISVSLVSSRAIRAFNRRFRKNNTATNVLAFSPFLHARALRTTREKTFDLGDVVICPDVVRREARDSRTLFYTQFFWVVAHGILHSIGFDHERTGHERREMESIESDLLTEAFRKKFIPMPLKIGTGG